MTRQAAAVPVLSLGWRLRMAAEHASVKQPRLIEELGVSKSTITRWTHDEGRLPSRPNVRAWAELCNVDYGWLLTGEGTIVEPLRTIRQDNHDRAVDEAFDRWEAAEPTSTTDSGVTETSPSEPCR